eukprot:s3229_g6.t1
MFSKAHGASSYGFQKMMVWSSKAESRGKMVPKKLAALRVTNTYGSFRGPSIGASHLQLCPVPNIATRRFAASFSSESFANLWCLSTHPPACWATSDASLNPTKDFNKAKNC